MSLARVIALMCAWLLGGSLWACQGAAPERELVVYAAASLREAFTTLGRAFERAHPEVELRFNFAGTQELSTQLLHGARVDLFASADPHHIAELVRAGLLGTPAVFARNEPVLVVADEARGRVRSFAELDQARRIVLGTPEVPIGRYSAEILDRAARVLGSEFRDDVERNVVSRELNVRQVLTKVRLGEADAALVYRSDLNAQPSGVTALAIPEQINVVAEYPVAVAARAREPELAGAFVELLLSTDGQRALENAGFRSARRDP